MKKIKEKPTLSERIKEKAVSTPRELLRKGLDDGSERLRTQLRDTAQQGRRDEYGGDAIEDTAASGLHRAEKELLKQRKKKNAEQSASPRGDALCSAFFFLRCFSSSFSARCRPLAAVSSMASPPYSSRRPCWAVSRSCVRSRSEPSSKPLRSSSLGVDTAFSLMRSESVGFSLIFFIAHHAIRSEGRVVII